MNYQTVRLEGTGPVRHLVLNRPEIHNAVNLQLVKDVHSACLELDEDKAVRAVIVRGAGKSFCSGADLKANPAKGSVADRMFSSKAGARTIDALTYLRPITIAAMHGYAIGGGGVLGAACDFRIGAESLSLTINEVSIGFNLTWHTIPAVVQLIGPARAKEMIILGHTYDAKTLLEYGFLNKVVPDAQLIATAEALAAEIVNQPPVPTTLTKASINAYSKALDRSVQHMDHLAVAFVGQSGNSKLARETYFAKQPRNYVDE